MVLPEDASALVRALSDQGYECYAVGGCVRDYLLGSIPHDWDFATNATVEIMKRLFTERGLKWIPTGEAHGTLTVLTDTHEYEVTTYRIDGDYSDGRHPDQGYKIWISTSFEQWGIRS